MAWLGALAAIVLIAVVLIDAFEVMILPRRVSYPWRLARLFYQTGWIAWRAACQGIRPGRRRQLFLSVFGPLSLLMLMGLWALGLIAGFALLHWSLGTPLPSCRREACRVSATTSISAASPSSPWAMATWCRRGARPVP